MDSIRFAPQNCAANDPPLYPYWVSVTRAGRVVAEFEAMATDSCACVIQHVDSFPDCKIEVCGLDEHRTQLREARNAQYEQKFLQAMDHANRGQA